MADETPASPTGQLVGPSKLWNDLPPAVQNVVVVLVFAAVVISPAMLAQPEAFPLWAKVTVATLAGLGGPLGMISAGVRKAAPALLLVLGLSLSSCTASQAFIVTGESIKATGRQYVATEEAMRKGVDQGKVTPAQFKAWVMFSDKFELVWDSAAAAWLRAREAKAQVEQGKLEAAIASVMAELTGFYVKAKEAHLLPAGAP